MPSWPARIAAPHLGNLPHLQALALRSTGISEWPDGLFEQPRPSGFYLDMQNTAINSVPHFLPWQPEAELVARARLDRNHLSAQAEQRLISYRLEAVLLFKVLPHLLHPVLVLRFLQFQPEVCVALWRIAAVGVQAGFQAIADQPLLGLRETGRHYGTPSCQQRCLQRWLKPRHRCDLEGSAAG